MYRLLIEDEVSLRQTLTDTEEEQSIQWEQLINR
jgi:hypothetical protein